jgi:prepilin-type processing-associated H-X9-DG protein
MVSSATDTALFTDAYLPKGNTLWGVPWPYIYAMYSGPITNPHPFLPGNHAKPGTPYSAGLNVCMVDGSVLWLNARDGIEKGAPGYRYDVRPRCRHRQYYNNIYW